MLAKRLKVVCILGPTCAGKSDLALWLVPRIGGEVVNADSMQVYRHFDIGSAKPDTAAREQAPHHVVDVAEPDEAFNAARFQKMADQAVREISARESVPVIVGGTGLYLRVLFHGLFDAPTDTDLRNRLKTRFQEDPLSVYRELERHDPAYARSISPHDRVRVVRALEIYYLSGVAMSEHCRLHGFRDERYDAYRIGLSRERAELYGGIERRVDLMLRRGWVEEVEGLLRRYPLSARPFQGIGYREIVLHLTGKIGYQEMVEAIKRATRRYAKRQLTWFSKEKGIEWHRYPEERDAILEKIGGFLS
jgi:tRNA dimethylallyltransferase